MSWGMSGMRCEMGIVELARGCWRRREERYECHKLSTVRFNSHDPFWGERKGDSA